jgi:D-psicose/D-tagatose/L-ribulose 3-epimerase
VPWQEVADALSTIDYQGVVSIESFIPEIKELARAVSMWRPVFESGDQMAEQGHAFLRGLFNNA